MNLTLILEAIPFGDIMRDIVKIFPETANSFEQRKTYDEYYYKETKVELTIERLEALKEWYSITIEGDCLLVK